MSLPAGIERDTLLWPEVIAETVCAEVSRFLNVEMPAAYAGQMAAKAERCYAGNSHFRKLMRGRGNAPRAWLYAFMRHWLCGIFHRTHPQWLRRLPLDYCLGKPIASRNTAAV